MHLTVLLEEVVTKPGLAQGTAVSWTTQGIENILDIWIFMCKVTMAQKLWGEQQKYGITFLVIELKLISKQYLD